MPATQTTLTFTLYYPDGLAAKSVNVNARRIQASELADVLAVGDTYTATSHATTGVVTFTLDKNVTVPVIYLITLPDKRYFYLYNLASQDTISAGVIYIYHSEVPANERDITALIMANLVSAIDSGDLSATGNLSEVASPGLSLANLHKFTTTATAGATTTLLVSSTHTQVFTGTLTQTIVLPVAATLQTGFEFLIINNSTGTLTVQPSSGLGTVASIEAGGAAFITCVLASGTTTSSWDAIYIPDVVTALALKLDAANLLRVRQTADATYTTNAVLANTDLNLTVPIGTWSVEVALQDNQTTNGGIQIAFAGAAVLTSARLQYVGMRSAAGTLQQGSTVTEANILSSPYIDTNSSARTVWVTGFIEVGTQGTFILQAAQAVSHSDTTTLYKGAHMILTKVS